MFPPSLRLTPETRLSRNSSSQLTHQSSTLLHSMQPTSILSRGPSPPLAPSSTDPHLAAVDPLLHSTLFPITSFNWQQWRQNDGTNENPLDWKIRFHSCTISLAAGMEDPPLFWCCNGDFETLSPKQPDLELDLELEDPNWGFKSQKSTTLTFGPSCNS